MTDKAVSALTSLTGATTATGDLLYIVDISEAAAADRSKKITAQELQNYLKTFPATIGVGGATPAASGAGISFPATASASSDANTLDDYEEGTFDPEVTFGGASTGLTYTSKAGFYRKIGGLVFFSFRIVLSAKGSSTGNAKISLPFPAANISRPGGANLMYGTSFTTVTAAEITLDADQNASIAALYNITAGVALTDANFQNTTDFIAAFCYIAA